MNTKSIIVGSVLLVLIAGAGWYANHKSDTTATNTVGIQVPEKIIEVTLAKRVLTPNIVTVNEGDKVTIRVTGDEAGEFHVSGYDLENDMEAGKLLSFNFVAKNAGRYNFELHPEAEITEVKIVNGKEVEVKKSSNEDIVVGAFVVNPR